MQISATPLKWTIPFATNDNSKVEIPATTSDPTRFSLSLGSPPLTGQPPESGGVPPQLEDFNGAINQIARFTWWAIGGGPLPFDGTWAADPNVNGYANGAQIPTADGQGRWISTADNNTNNPDTVGTNWAPGWAYGSLSLTGLAGGTTTLTPAQAIKRSISLAGTLTSNLTVVVPAWVYDWTFTNNTTGAFTVTVKTAAGSGILVPQNGLPTPLAGDGTNVTQLARNIAIGTSPTSAVQFSQIPGPIGAVRKLFMSVTAASASGTLTADEILVGDALAGGRIYQLGSFNKTINLATTGAGGMDTGTAPVSGYVAIYAIYNPTTGVSALLGVNATSAAAPTIYGGANLPAGFTASALVAVWPTNASSQFVIGVQRDRRFSWLGAFVLQNSTINASLTLLSIAAGVPLNAIACSGQLQVSSTAASNMALVVAADGNGTGQQNCAAPVATGSVATIVSFSPLLLITPQTIYYKNSNSAGTPSFNIYIDQYEI